MYCQWIFSLYLFIFGSQTLQMVLFLSFSLTWEKSTNNFFPYYFLGNVRRYGQQQYISTLFEPLLIAFLVERNNMSAYRPLQNQPQKMVSTKFLNIITVLSHEMFSKATTQQCENEYSVPGKMLKGFTFKTMKVKSPSECLHTCKGNDRCQSFNYVILENICELNNRTKEARPEDLEVDPRRYYFQVKRTPQVSFSNGTFININ